LYNPFVKLQDVERIARGALRDLGVSDATISVTAHEAQPDTWCIEVTGRQGPTMLTIRGGAGSSPQWIREQVLNQFQSR